MILNHVREVDGKLYWTKTISNRAIEGTEAGTIKQNGYVEIQYKKRRYYVHRLIWELYNGVIPDTHVIDHINRNPTDNRIENLRCVERTNNLHNASLSSRNKSKYLGISWDKRSNCWQAEFMYKKKRVYRHSFIDKEQAIQTLQKVKDMYLGTNFRVVADQPEIGSEVSPQ